MVITKVTEPTVVDNSTPDDSAELAPDSHTVDAPVVPEDTTVVDGGDPPELPHKWMSAMTQDQKNDAELVKAMAKFESGVPDLIKSYVELERNRGIPAKPDENATEEEIAAYRESIGVPKTAEDYKLDDVKVPDDFEIDEETQKAFLSFAHENDMPNDLTNKLHQWYFSNLATQLADGMKICKDSEEEAMQKLATEVGEKDFKAAGTYMARSFERFSTPEVADLFEKSGLGNHQGVIRMFINMGKAFSEHAFVEPDGTAIDKGVVGDRTNAQIAASIYPAQKEQ